MSMDYENIDWSKDKTAFLNYLYSLKDDKYKEFSKKTTPGEFEMIGLNIPLLKSIAKCISKTDYEEFLALDDENIFELRMLKGFVISNIKDIDEYIRHFHTFLPLINNWAICDSFIASSKIIKKNEAYFFTLASELLESKSEFKDRVAFVILLDYFVKEDYLERVFELIRGYKSDAYYANMALAWLLSVLYVKFPKRTQSFLIKSDFDPTVIKYTIRKIKDSYRVTNEDKEWLKKLTSLS